MKKFIVIAAVTLLTLSCGAPRKTSQKHVNQTSETYLRIGTFNLWRSDIGKGDFRWEVRKARLAQAVIDNGFDIFGGEEVDTTIQRELPALLESLGGKYDWYTFSPYSQDGNGDKAQSIIYRRDRFEVLESHYFWYSDTPDLMSCGWDDDPSKGWDELAKFKRGGCCIMFREKTTGQEFLFMLSHFPLKPGANLHAAQILNDRARMYNPKGLPAFFVGDLNTRPETPSTECLKTYWNDAFLDLPSSAKKGPSGTFNGAQMDRDMETAIRIDYIYYKGATILPLKYVCNTKTYDGFYPSDHCPVYVDFVIGKSVIR